MSGGISEALKRLAAEYGHATTQKERDRIWHEIMRVSYRQERDREGSHRRNTDMGRLEASMQSLGRGAESVRNGGVEMPEDVIEEAMKRLSERDKAFARDVLDGKGWRELELGKRGFNKRLARICLLLGSHPLQKPSL